MKATKATAKVVVYGQPMSVKRVTKPALAEALNDAAKAIERQRAELARRERELAEREKQLVQSTAQASGLKLEVNHLRGGQDRSDEFVSFRGSLVSYKEISHDQPTIAEMTDLVSQWKVIIERFAVVDYDFVAKPLKFRGNTLNITLAQGEGIRKLSFASSPGQPERWAFYLGLMVMNRTRWSTRPVWVEGQNGRKFVSHITATLKSGSEPVVVTQAPRDFVMSLRGS